jgi:hypothetical protein
MPQTPGHPEKANGGREEAREKAQPWSYPRVRGKVEFVQIGMERRVIPYDAAKYQHNSGG